MLCKVIQRALEHLQVLGVRGVSTSVLWRGGRVDAFVLVPGAF